VVGLLYVIIAFGFNFFCFYVRVSRWGKDVAQTCESSFLSDFGGRSLSSQLHASVIMSLAMLKGNFERIAFSLSRIKLLR